MTLAKSQQLCSGRVPMSQEGLLDGLRHLAESLDLVGDVTYGRRFSRIAAIEACAHEVAHYIFTGSNFESRLLSMSEKAANRHEASALRVEVAVLDRLGCKVPLRSLWLRSNWNCVDGRKRPPWITLIAPLTVRENRCVLVMIRKIQKALWTVCQPGYCRLRRAVNG
jgi:hypothetical protein